jgi:hypothetical protein
MLHIVFLRQINFKFITKTLEDAVLGDVHLFVFVLIKEIYRMKPKKCKEFNPRLGPLRLPKQLSENDKRLREQLKGKTFLFPLLHFVQAH